MSFYVFRVIILSVSILFVCFFTFVVWCGICCFYFFGFVFSLWRWGMGGGGFCLFTQV